MQQLARARHRAARQLLRQLGRQPRLDAGLGQALRQVEHVGRAGAGHGRHRVDQALVVDPGHLADRAQQRVARGPLRRRDVRVRHRHRDAAPDRGRRVRHRAHHRRAFGQMLLEAGDGAAGGDRQHHRALAGEPRQRREHLVHHLRLDGHHDHRRRLRQRGDCGLRNDAVLDQQLLTARRRRRVLHDDLSGVEAALQPSRQHRHAHVAGTGQQQRSVDLQSHWRTFQNYMRMNERIANSATSLPRRRESRTLGRLACR